MKKIIITVVAATAMLSTSTATTQATSHGHQIAIPAGRCALCR